MRNCYVRIGVSKDTGRKYYALVVEFRGGERKMFFFSKKSDFLSLLNLSPLDFDALDVGDYEIK